MNHHGKIDWLLHTLELQNPLFIHPSDGPGSITASEKLVGSRNYRTWRRSMEMSLATKRKPAFVQGTLIRPSDDPIKAEQWDTCNNMIIAWIMNCVSDTIGRSILYIQSAREIWLQLEKRFCLSNGSLSISWIKKCMQSNRMIVLLVNIIQGSRVYGKN